MPARFSPRSGRNPDLGLACWVSRECVIGQSASQGGDQSTLAAGTVFESTADTFLRIQSDIYQIKQTRQNIVKFQSILNLVKKKNPLQFRDLSHSSVLRHSWPVIPRQSSKISGYPNLS